jgi:hypothetical protein
LFLSAKSMKNESFWFAAVPWQKSKTLYNNNMPG